MLIFLTVKDTCITYLGPPYTQIPFYIYGSASLIQLNSGLYSTTVFAIEKFISEPYNSTCVVQESTVSWNPCNKVDDYSIIDSMKLWSRELIFLQLSSF